MSFGRSLPLPAAWLAAGLLCAAACGGGGRDLDGAPELDTDADGAPDVGTEGGIDADARQPDADPGPLPCPDGSPPAVDRGDLAVGAPAMLVVLSRCTMDSHGLVAAGGSRLEISLVPVGPFPMLVAVAYPDDPSWEGRIAVARTGGWGEETVLPLEVPRSGELVLLVASTTVEAGQAYELSARCTDGCELEATRFPIVLVHGWTGFASIGPIDYFYGIPALLRDRGFQVFVAELDPYNSVEVRSGQLAVQVDGFLAAGRARKVGIIAHSQGGLDSRHMISTLGYGDRVSALVTVATPHRGTPIADIALGLMPGDSELVLYFLLELLGAAAAGAESDAEASFRNLSEQHVREVFNPATPDDPRVSYVSWTGRTCLYGITCDDVCEPAIRLSYELIFLASGPNDGIVPVESAAWGEYRGEVPADHFDEVGQLFGVTGPSFDHREFYLGLARDLTAEGH